MVSWPCEEGHAGFSCWEEKGLPPWGVNLKDQETDRKQKGRSKSLLTDFTSPSVPFLGARNEEGQLAN